MESNRLLIVSPRFWPVSGVREMLVAGLAEALADLGHRVTVVTWQITRSWPQHFRHGGFEVVRVPRRRDGLLNTLRRRARHSDWTAGLSRWLIKHGDEFDFAMVVADDSENGEIGESCCRAGLPCVIRWESSPCPIPGASECGTPVAHIHADPAVTSESGLPVIDGWADRRAHRFDRQQIRRSLAEAHPLFNLADQALLVVCHVPLVRDSGLLELVRAWQAVVRRHPTARLWLIGEGESGYEIFQRIRELDLEHAVILPGHFDELADLVEAADGVVLPAAGHQADWFVRSATEAGKPLIVPAGNRKLIDALCRTQRIGSGSQICCYQEAKLDRVLLEWADRMSAAARPAGPGVSGTAVTSAVAAEGSLGKMARQYVTLGRSLGDSAAEAIEPREIETAIETAGANPTL